MRVSIINTSFSSNSVSPEGWVDKIDADEKIKGALFMGWIQDWKVRTKIVVIVTVFALVAGGIGWRGLSGADLLNSSITTIVQVNVPRIAESQSLLVNLLQLQRTEKNHILSESQEQLEQRERNYRKKRKRSPSN